MKVLIPSIVGLLLCAAVQDARSCEAHKQGHGPGSIAEIQDGVIRPGGIFNVLTYDAPAAMALKDSGLKEAGLAAGSTIRKSDEIRIFTGRDVLDAAPLARIWFNAGEGGAYWFQTGGDGEAGEFVIPKGAVVVVWTRASADAVSWENVFD